MTKRNFKSASVNFARASEDPPTVLHIRFKKLFNTSSLFLSPHPSSKLELSKKTHPSKTSSFFSCSFKILSSIVFSITNFTILQKREQTQKQVERWNIKKWLASHKIYKHGQEDAITLLAYIALFCVSYPWLVSLEPDSTTDPSRTPMIFNRRSLTHEKTIYRAFYVNKWQTKRMHTIENNMSILLEQATITLSYNLLTCEATVRLSATPPAFKLMRKTLQSESSWNLLIALSLAVIVIDPSNRTQVMPDWEINCVKWRETPLVSKIAHNIKWKMQSGTLTFFKEYMIKSKKDVNWLNTIPFAEPSLSIINLISSLYFQWHPKKAFSKELLAEALLYSYDWTTYAIISPPTPIR